MADEGTPPEPPRFPPPDDTGSGPPSWPPEAPTGPPSWPPDYAPPPYGSSGWPQQPASVPPWLGAPRQHWLHPLTVGRTFSSAWRLYRTHWRSLLGAAAVLLLPAQLILAVVQAYVVGPSLQVWEQRYGLFLEGRTPMPTDIPAGEILVSVAASFAFGILLFVGLAAVIRIVDQSYNGRPATAGDGLRTALRRAPTLIGLTLLTSLAIIVVIAAAAAIAFIAGSVATAVAGPGLGFFVLLVGLVGMFAAIVFVTLRVYLAPQVVIAEGSGAVQALRRSWRLVDGSTWRLLGYLLLAVLVMMLVGFVFSILVVIVSFREIMSSVLSSVGPIGTTVPTAPPVIVLSPQTTFITTMLSGLYYLFTLPFLMAVMTLFYYDLRWRRGELDRPTTPG